MNRRPDIDAHAAAKRRVYAKRKRREKAIAVTLLTVTILAVWGIIGVILYKLWSPEKTPEETFLSAEITTAEPIASTEPSVTVATEPQKHESVTVDNSMVHSGDLILISTLLGHKYSFEENDSGLTVLYGNKTGSYRIANISLKLLDKVVKALNTMFDAYKAETGNGDYNITQAFRSLEEQKAIYDDYQKRYGKEQGALLAALPEYSEHHSGMAFDMSVYTSAGIGYSLANAREKNEIYGWIYDHADEYGFILRYPENRTSVTGITNEPWHFRYVGKGHAKYIYENGLVLEEYIALLYKYPENGEHLTIKTDSAEYEVYYKAASTGTTTTLSIPKGIEYSVSGNNIDGFIVTLVK